MAYVNTLGLTSKIPIVTIFVTCKIQTTVHTQPVYVDMTHFRTKCHAHSSRCPVVTVIRPIATENVCMATTLLCSFPKRRYLKIRCKSYHDISSHIISLPQNTRLFPPGDFTCRPCCYYPKYRSKKHVVRLASNGISITGSFVQIGRLLPKLK